MEERLNIWGKTRCNLPNGKLCGACCVLPNIELEGDVVSVAKPENSPCPYLNGIGGGCSRHAFDKPASCVDWHCSKVNNEYKLELVAEALALGQVTLEEAENVSLNLDMLGDFCVEKEAERLKNITYKKELIGRDLVEP